MKNKLVLMLLMLTSMSAAAENKQQHFSYIYYDLSEKFAMLDGAIVQATLICAAWASKFTVYNFTELESDNVITFLAYNHDCCFRLKFDRNANECLVEFNARDDSFDYSCFEKNMDSFFSSV